MEKKFAIEQKVLLTLLSSMQPICMKRTTIDATNSILFQVGQKELVLKSTDLEISLQASCLMQESNCAEPETFLVSGKRIFDVVKELEGVIFCTFTKTQLLLQAGSVNLALNSKDAQEFPPFPECIENLMHLDAKFLLDMLDKVAFLIPQNNANLALNGLFLELSPDELKMTTTDGHCLAQVRSANYKLDINKTWLLPRRAIFELKKILENSQDATIFLGVCGNQLVFSGELFNFFTKLLANPFPQYKAILDKKDFFMGKIERNKFIKTLRRSVCLLSGQFLATQFSFENYKVQVSLDNKEVGKLDEILPIQVQDLDIQALDIKFFAPYLLSGIQVLDDDNITFFLKNGAKPIMFESQQATYHITYLVMPVSPTMG